MSESNIKAKVGHMVAGIQRGLRLMTRRERQMAALLVFTSLFDGLLQMATIVAIIPIIQVMLDPSANLSGQFLSWLEPWFGVSDRKVFLVQLSSGLMALVLLKGLFNWLQIGWASKFSMNCEVRLSSFMMNRILRAPYIWLVQQNSSRLRQLLFGFVSIWSRQFIRPLVKLTNDIIFVLWMIAVLIWADPRSGMLTATIATLLGAVIFLIVRPKLMRLAEEKRRGILGATNVSTEAVFGVKEVKMAGAEDRFTSLFDEQVQIYSGSDAQAQQWSQLPRIALEFLAYGALIAISIAVVYSGVENAGVGGIILLYGLASIRLLPIFSTVVSGLTTLIGTFPVLADLETLISSTQTLETSAPKDVSPIPWNEVRLENVSFHYQEASRPALDAVSLSIERGCSYGVVGPSGAGKSTLIDVVAGLLDPTDGKVMIDGGRLKADHKSAWRQQFGYVGQRPFLLDASLRENILFNKKSIDDESRLVDTILLACLERVVDRLPGGLDGRVGEQGAFLSGGERQRVAIARALYRGADLLILDEATSSLDPLVEQEVAESIKALHGQVATIIVSHRLGLVRDCDEIWVFEDASLSARGTHAELLRSSDLYNKMVIQSARSAHGGHFSTQDFDRSIVTPPG